MNSNSADLSPNQEEGPQVLFCSACGLKFQPIKDKSKSLCPVCTNNYTKDPDFEEVLLSLAYGHFTFNLGFRNPEVILRKAFKRVLEFNYWQSKKEQYQDYLDKNLEDLKEKLYDTIIFYEVGNEIKQMRNELEIEADKFDIFISHSWDGPESELVLPLVKALKGSDYSVWFDKDLGLDPGDVKDYLKSAINDSKYCVPIFCKSYFEKENTLFELENILALKKKKNIFPIWFSDIDTDFLKNQGDLGKDALTCSAITWKNAGEDLNVVVKKLEEFIEASQEIETYNGVKLYERDVNVLKYFERSIGETIPEIISKSEEDPKFGFMHENQHLTGIFLKETSENKKVQPLHLPKDIFKLKYIKYLHAPLIDLPPQISRLENLVELDISDGIVSELPDLTHLKSLKKFEIMGCGITKCDENTMDFCDKFFNWRIYTKDLNQHDAFYLGVMLNEMDINEEMPEIEFDNDDVEFGYSYNESGEIINITVNNKDLNFLPETIATFSKLKKLHLDKNYLSSLPASIGQLNNLEKLDLHYNQLSSLPASIGQLSNLKTLDLHGNKLSSLPASIGQLNNLKTLDLYGNKLSFLPESIGQLNNLEYLSIGKNELSSLPESIGQLNNLKTLNLKWNKLSSLPESIGQLNNLKTLDLYGNELSFLPESIGQLNNLKTLDLHGNKFSSLPESIVYLINLEDLSIHNNQFSSLPESIGRLNNLQKLDIGGNPLSSLPESIVNLTNLEDLSIHNNQFSSLPESIGDLKNLQTLNLSYNKLSSLPESIGDLKNLQTLNLSYNKLSSLPESIGQLNNLKTLDLYGNKLSFLPESIGRLTNLETLNLKQNQLSSLPESIGRLTNLQVLSLWQNRLSSLPASIGNLTNLKELNLKQNQLSSLPESIGDLKNLKKLYLDTNQLSSLPASIGRLTNLQKLYLVANQLSYLPERIKAQLRKLRNHGCYISGVRL